MTDQPQITKNLPNVKIIGKAGSTIAYKIRDYLQRSDVPFEWLEVTNDEQAHTDAGVDSLQDSRLPVCVFSDGSTDGVSDIRQITEKPAGFAVILPAPSTISLFMARVLQASVPPYMVHPKA